MASKQPLDLDEMGIAMERPLEAEMGGRSLDLLDELTGAAVGLTQG